MKSSLVTCAVAAAVGLLACAGYGLWYRAVAAKSAAVADLEHQITTTLQTAKRLTAVRATLAQITADEMLVRNYFVPQTEVVSFINDLEARGSALKAAVHVASVSTGGTTVRPTLEFAISVNGSFDAVMRTIGAIEYAPYALSVKQLSFRRGATNDWYADMHIGVESVSANPSTTNATTP